jgi:hypothetical protein
MQTFKDLRVPLREFLQHLGETRILAQAITVKLPHMWAINKTLV